MLTFWELNFQKNELAVIRGGTLEDGVLRVMAHLITNNVPMQFTQEGSGGQNYGVRIKFILLLTSVNSLHVSCYLNSDFLG